MATPSWDSRAAADRWRDGAATRRAVWEPVYPQVFDRARIGPGARVLDLGAGTGDQTFALLPRIGPTGSVLATDLSAGMLAALAEEAASRGAANVETLVADAGALDLPSAGFDAAISMNCVQFIPDRAEALGRVRRALKPGRTLAAVVAAGAATPITEMYAIVRRVGDLPPPAPLEPHVFALGDPAVFAATLRSGGFSGVEVTGVPIFWRFPSVDAAVAHYVGTPNFIAMLDRLSAGQRTDAVAGLTDLIGRHAGPDGVRLDGMVLLGSGTA